MPRAACFVLQCKDDGAAIAEELTAADLDIFIVDEEMCIRDRSMAAQGMAEPSCVPLLQGTSQAEQ